MTERVDLDAVDALTNAATEGPWESEEMPETGECRVIRVESDGSAPTIWPITFGGSTSGEAEFIAQARSLVPAMSAELRELRAQEYWKNEYETAEDMKRELRAEVERLSHLARLAEAVRGELAKTAEGFGGMGYEDGAVQEYAERLLALFPKVEGGDERGDASDKFIIINGMGGHVCSVCETPVESEPCEEHQQDAYTRAEGITIPEGDTR